MTLIYVGRSDEYEINVDTKTMQSTILCYFPDYKGTSARLAK